MAVTVVKEPPTSYRAQCRRCGAVFMYGLTDLGCRYDTPGDREWVKCPSCGQQYAHPNQSEGAI